MEVTVEWGALQAKLNRLANIGQTLKIPLNNGAAKIYTFMRTYPPQSEANAPKAHGRWYKRGTGTMYARKDGGITVRRTSQMLNRRWSMRRTFTNTLAEVVIGNSASYVRFVHDARKQARFHGRRGWRTAQDAVARFGPEIRADIERAIAAEIAK